MKSDKLRRIDSLDIVRGTIVLLSVLLFSIPIKINWLNVHADWYGFTVIDIILPAFITIFGTSMAIAYRKGINKKRFLSRTLKLLLYGLIFNIIVSWSFDLDTLRVTGVLQLFAILGIATVIITRIIKKPLFLFIISVLIFILHGLILINSSEYCGNNLPSPSCNPSKIIDTYIFGENHIYVQGKRGFDPEGIPSMFGALGNVLLGYVVGLVILRKKKIEMQLIMMILIALIMLLITVQFIPIGKRLWTPSFGFLTVGITITLILINYYIFDRKSADMKFVNPIKNLLIAFGRNSFLIYFGKYLLDSLLRNITINVNNSEQSLRNIIKNFLDAFSPIEGLLYAVVIFSFWLIIAIVCHKKRWYFKV